MENSRKSRSDSVLAQVAATLSPVPSGALLLLGLSGGVDSVVLLHLLCQLAPRCGWRISALHVHHGISTQADAWAAFCAELCLRYSVPFQLEKVDITPLRSLGIEAAARRLRHATLAQQRVDFVALAHHLDDQAETVLLQLLRGSGVRGASAMPLIRRHGAGPALIRPLLDVTRFDLLDYARQHGLQWVEDESNTDAGYPRNFLRHRVLPTLEQRFPAYRKTLARSARHFAEASDLLQQLAQQDGEGAIHGEQLDIARLRSLNQVRAKNLLRYFIAARGAAIPDSTRLEEMLRQLRQARHDAAVCISYGDWRIRCYQDRVYVLPGLPELDPQLCVRWAGEAALPLSRLGMLHFDIALGQGVSWEKLQQSIVTVRLRNGSEQIRLHAQGATRALKNLLQEHSIPPWQRRVLPLLFCGDMLVAIPGIGVEYSYRANPAESGRVLRWEYSVAGRASDVM
jgi:tRNA(Ile)-lysidine synthase